MKGILRNWMIGLTALALVLTACGSNGSAASPAHTSAAATASGGSCQSAAGLSGTVNDHGTQPSSASTVALEAEDFFFSPTSVRGGGGKLTVTVENKGQALHNFSITSLGIDQDVPSGQSITVEVQLPASGVLPFFCK